MSVGSPATGVEVKLDVAADGLPVSPEYRALEVRSRPLVANAGEEYLVDFTVSSDHFGP